MPSYQLNKVVAEGSATIDQATGKTIQVCTVTTEVVGAYANKFLQNDLTSFEVDSTSTIADAWINIETVQAPAWVAANYPSN